LGANVTFSAPASTYVDLRGALNANGHSIFAVDVDLGYSGGPFTLLNRGPINAQGLLVSSQYSPAQTTFNLTPADSTQEFDLFGVSTSLTPGVSVPFVNLLSNGASPPAYATATTSTVGNVTSGARIGPGCTLTLGADLLVSGGSALGTLQLDGTLNANGHTISASGVQIDGTGGPVAIHNDGLLTTGTWTQKGGSTVRLNYPGDSLGSLLLSANSSLTFGDAAGQTTGLTLSSSNLSIAAGSDLMLEVNGLASGWVFRWANPSGGDHIADLQTLINNGEVTFSYLNGGSYSLSADSSYTYVNVIPVPEPSTLLLTAVAGGLIGLRIRKRPGIV
jgi:hypothetical protein